MLKKTTKRVMVSCLSGAVLVLVTGSGESAGPEERAPSALVLSAAQGDRSVVSSLLRGDVHAGATQGGRGVAARRSALHVAAREGHHGIVADLLRGRAGDALESAQADWLPLHSAVAFGQVDAVRVLIEKRPEAMNRATAQGWTPAHLAAITGWGGTLGLAGAKGATVSNPDVFGMLPSDYIATDRFIAEKPPGKERIELGDEYPVLWCRRPGASPGSHSLATVAVWASGRVLYIEGSPAYIVQASIDPSLIDVLLATLPQLGLKPGAPSMPSGPEARHHSICFSINGAEAYYRSDWDGFHSHLASRTGNLDVLDAYRARSFAQKLIWAVIRAAASNAKRRPESVVSFSVPFLVSVGGGEWRSRGSGSCWFDASDGE